MISDLDVDRAVGHMGYPLLEWSFTLFRSRMNELSSISASSATRLTTVLDNLDALQQARTTYILAASGTQVLAGGIVYYRSAKVAELNVEINYWRNKLSLLLSVAVVAPTSAVGRRV
jgi:hypothetical protein